MQYAMKHVQMKNTALTGKDLLIVLVAAALWTNKTVGQELSFTFIVR